jgi:O-glycosyl hydrolase
MMTNGERSWVRRVAVAVMLAGSLPATAATVTIDDAVTYQTIEGFGGFGGMKQWWSSPPFHDAAFVNLMVNDLGLTMVRIRADGNDFEPSNDNSDPNVLNMSGFNTTTSKFAQHFAYFRALKARADAEGEPLAFIGSFWTPPKWMKTNNSLINGGHLKTSAYAEYGEYLIAFLTAMKQECGIDVYAVSPQNEPAFEEPYESCVYTPTEMRDLVKVIGPMIHAKFPDVKLFAAEDMLHNWSKNPFAGTLMADPQSRAQVHALAVHGYHDGVVPTPTSQAALLWGTAAHNCAGVGKPLWMTETSGYASSWSGAFDLGEAIYASLKYGKLAAWVWWTIAQTASDRENYRLTLNGVPNKKYYVSKQYYRYVRPGAVMIGCESDDANVLACAFRHAADRTLTVVLLNTSTGSKSVSLSGEGLPACTAYRSSSSQNCANVGSVSGSVILPASSITTLYGEGYSSSAGSTRTGVRAARTAAASASPVLLYRLDGRLAGGASGIAVTARGVYCAAERRFGTGRTVVSLRMHR